MMQTIETTAIEPEADLGDCPFCGAEPYWLGVVIRGPSGRIEPHFYHPGVVTDKDCILSGQGYTLDEVAAWNTRQGSAALPSGERVTEICDEAVRLSREGGGARHEWRCAYHGAMLMREAMRATPPTAPDQDMGVPCGRLAGSRLDP